MSPRLYQLHQVRAAASCAARGMAPSLRLSEGFWGEVQQMREEQTPRRQKSLRRNGIEEIEASICFSV